MSGTTVTVNGAPIFVQDEGEARLGTAILVHGWPDTHRVWRFTVPALTAAGFRVIAPDLRGFGSSHKPADVADYALPHYLTDLIGLADALGVERFSLIGHDWGAGIAWATATLLADRVERLVAMSVGHPTAFRDADWEQRRRSWYMLLFTHPTAEQVFPRDGWNLLNAFGTCPDFDEYVAALSQPGALSASLNIYRANVPPEALFLGDPLVLPPVTAPTLGIWSDGDHALGEAQMERSAAFVDAPWRYERLAGCGHWMQVEAHERVNELVTEFLTSS